MIDNDILTLRVIVGRLKSWERDSVRMLLWCTKCEGVAVMCGCERLGTRDQIC